MSMFNGMWDDLRFVFRSLAKRPAFTAVADRCHGLEELAALLERQGNTGEAARLRREACDLRARHRW